MTAKVKTKKKETVEKKKKTSLKENVSLVSEDIPASLLPNEKYEIGKLYLLPKNLDEKVAKLHLAQLGAKLTKLTQKQADYISVSVDGPYKLDT